MSDNRCDVCANLTEHCTCPDGAKAGGMVEVRQWEDDGLTGGWERADADRWSPHPTQFVPAALFDAYEAAHAAVAAAEEAIDAYLDATEPEEVKP